MRHPFVPPTAALLGLAAAALVACSNSGKGLIPAADAGPLQRDFEAVARAAQAGNGDCTATEEALRQTERHFAALPANIDAGLHERLRQGVENLASRARAICAQPNATSTLTNTSTSTTSTSTTPSTTSTSTTSTSTSTTTSTPTTTSTTPDTGGETPAGGGTPGPPTGAGEGGGAGEGNGRGGNGQ